MKIFPSLFLILSCCLDLSNALPVSSQHHDRQQRNRRRVPYSVVPVDGGSTASATHVQTVTRTVTQSIDSTTTVTASPIAVGTTLVLTVVGVSKTSTSSLRAPISVVNPSQPTETVWVSIGSSPVFDSPSATLPTSSAVVSTPSTSQPTTTPCPLPTMPSVSSILVISTTTSATIKLESARTSKSYDNGQWHTMYPSWNSTSATSMATGAPLPTGYRR